MGTSVPPQLPLRSLGSRGRFCFKAMLKTYVPTRRRLRLLARGGASCRGSCGVDWLQWSAFVLPLAAALVMAFTATATAAGQDAPTPDPLQPERWSFHFQATGVGDAHDSFAALYSGENSLDPHSEEKASLTSTFFLGMRVRKGLRFTLIRNSRRARDSARSQGWLRSPTGRLLVSPVPLRSPILPALSCAPPGAGATPASVPKADPTSLRASCRFPA